MTAADRFSDGGRTGWAELKEFMVMVAACCSPALVVRARRGVIEEG